MWAIWTILKRALNGYIAHDALSRGAAIAFYVVTSLAPVLLIVVAIAGNAAEHWVAVYFAWRDKLDLSLGDMACLAVGRYLQLPVLTNDRNWRTIDFGVAIHLGKENKATG